MQKITLINAAKNNSPYSYNQAMLFFKTNQWMGIKTFFGKTALNRLYCPTGPKNWHSITYRPYPLVFPKFFRQLFNFFFIDSCVSSVVIIVAPDTSNNLSLKIFFISYTNYYAIIQKNFQKIGKQKSSVICNQSSK